ncbi:hypothetical protein ACRPPB_003574, partial [Klebsiella pneumoniae]
RFIVLILTGIRQGGVAGMSEKCDPEHYSVGEKAKICCKNHRDMTIERLPPVAKNLLQANTRKKSSSSSPRY